MDKPRNNGRSIAAAQRGCIIQRVLVDGWTPRRAAEAFGIEERRIAAWLRDYRRHGMAALRDDKPGAERIYRRALRRWSAGLQRARERWWGRPAQQPAANFVLLRGDETRSQR